MNSPCMKTHFFPCWGDDWTVWLDVFPGQTLCRVSHQGAFQAFSWWNSCFRATDPTKLKTKLSSSPKCLFAWFPNRSTNFLQLGVTSCCGSSRDVLCWCTVLDRHCWGQMLLQMIQAAHSVGYLGTSYAPISFSIALCSAPVIMHGKQAKNTTSLRHPATPTDDVSQGLSCFWVNAAACVPSLTADMTFLYLHLGKGNRNLFYFGKYSPRDLTIPRGSLKQAGGWVLPSRPYRDFWGSPS